jgi:threonine/homoserine efflux transporter RhtA
LSEPRDGRRQDGGDALLDRAFSVRSIGASADAISNSFQTGLRRGIPVACLVTLPLGVAHLDAIDGRAIGLGLVIAIGGLILRFALELEGLRRLEPRWSPSSTASTPPSLSSSASPLSHRA